MTMMVTTILEPKAPVAPEPGGCANCGSADAELFCLDCAPPHWCNECDTGPKDDEMMCTSCAQSYGLRTVRNMIEWRVLIGQLDKQAGAQVLELIEMAEERLP
jgi:hypothetical protein